MNNKNIKPYKKSEFELYILWKSLPKTLCGNSEEVITNLGFTDELVVELLNIRTQADFAERYHIKDLNTLSDWNKIIDEKNLIKPSWAKWSRELTPNVVSILYGKCRQGDPNALKMWFDIVERVKEKPAENHQDDDVLNTTNVNNGNK